MRAIGLDHPTRGLTGSHRATTEKDITQGIGKEIAAVSNTITTGIRNMTGITTIKENTVITTMTMKSR